MANAMDEIEEEEKSVDREESSSNNMGFRKRVI